MQATTSLWTRLARRVRQGSEALTWLVAAAALLLALLPPAAHPPPAPAVADSAVETDASAGDLDLMIGQMLVLGFEGRSPSDGWTRKMLSLVRSGRIGGVLLMTQNIASRTQVAALTAALREASPPLPLLIAIDEEGGAVQRLGPKQGIDEVPSAATIARTGSPEAAARTYASLAADLRTLGINLNLGPVVDLARNRSNPIIVRQQRSYGADPVTVTAFARAFIRAHRQAGVLTAAKHFPGHGSSAADSHLGKADVSATWSDVELDPYRRLIASEPPPIVMVGHLHLDKLGGDDGLPATLSSAAIDGVLRRDMGYQGVVITDDLDMRAIRQSYAIEDAAVRAIAAGNDLILVSNSSRPDPDLADRLHQRIRAAIRDGTLSRARIEQAYGRIKALKQHLSDASARRDGS